MKRFITYIAAGILFCVSAVSNLTPTTVTAYATECNQIQYTHSDLDTLVELMEKQDSNMNAAHQMAQAARHLNYEEEHDIIILAKAEWSEANNLKNEYKNAYDDLMQHWYQKEQEYPKAAYIWKYFKDLGYNDYVCAGILGNIMAEVGGHTLDIKTDIQKNGYYGMCQWNQAYSEVWGASLEEQCNFLQETIAYEFDTFGYAYDSGFDYESFLELKNCKQAAKAFAKCYERCGIGSYSARQKNAIEAYNYFVG